MNTLPTKWYIGVTEENRDELDRWRKKVATSHRDYDLFANHSTLLSVHPFDGSYYYHNSVEEIRNDENYKDYQEITLEQFRQITNPKLPEKWYIGVTRENRDELDRWRKKVATSHRSQTLKVGYTLLSKHHGDNSYYYASTIEEFRDNKHYKDYQEITLEQFRQITNSTPTPKPMTKSIQISRELLNEYYEASTPDQKAYLTEHFKLDGTTTDEAIRGLHEMACSKWQPRIRKNHPECFPEDSKHFDFSNRFEEHGAKGLVSNDVVESLGIRSDFIQIRRSDNPKTHARSFYLTTDYNWELVKDGIESGGEVWVLIPTKKKS